jgi:tRNA (mo5U34)-methyltransferase
LHAELPDSVRGSAVSDAEPDAALAAVWAPFFRQLSATPAGAWAGPLRRLTLERLRPQRHGDLPDWLATLHALPDIAPGVLRLQAPCVTVLPRAALAADTREALRSGLDALHPWRKGPFCLHGVRVDAEWRSDRKWARLAGAVAPLDGRLVLDVGCGNGYYGYRALGAGAALVLGIDPGLRFVLQFLAVNRYLRQERLAVLPAADTDLPAGSAFDSVLSMGVLYHRRDAQAHLSRLYQALRRGGQVVLETLVLAGHAPGEGPGDLLHPPSRYARMRNVHAIPGIDLLVRWVAAAGFRRIELVDISRTDTAEQRSTPWMRFESLDKCLDPADPTRTVEGHPAPTRALLLAERP